ncbi:hypothetical protein J6W34_06295 [bacterium]|nr:hypothetical protein [bacterium]
MTTKKDDTINTLKQELGKKDEELRQSQINFNKVMTANNELIEENKQLQASATQQEIMSNPYLDLTLDKQPYLDENMINTNMSIMVKQRLAGLYSTLTATANGESNGVSGMSV